MLDFHRCALRNIRRYFQPEIWNIAIAVLVPNREANVENSCSWEDRDGWKLLKKWHQSCCEIAVKCGDMFSETHFSMNKGLITQLDPSRIRIRGEDGNEFELPLSETIKGRPHFKDVVSSEIMAQHPEVTGKFPEMVRVSVGLETWFFLGPIELAGQV